MRIFVAYSFHPRDQWVKDMVCPIIEAFGSTPVTGEETFDADSISSYVRNEIRRSDALIGFTTRREAQDNADDNRAGSWPTHPWVVSELAAAYGAGQTRILEVRERGVDPQENILRDKQRITYDERARDKCLVDIVRAIGRWHQTAIVRIQLLPEDLATDTLRPLLYRAGLVCEYYVRTGNYEDGPFQTKILPIAGGLFIEATGVTRNDLIRVVIRYGEQDWSSDYESIDAYGIRLR